MKRITLIILAFIYVSAYGQTKDEYKVLIDSAIAMQKATYGPDIYLIDEKDQPYTPMSDELTRKFKYISVYDKRNKKRLKKGINAWKILPTMNGNKLTINIIDFIITYQKNNYTFGNRGGATVVFEYARNSNKWVLLSTKWSGL